VTYERMTAASTTEALRAAVAVLTERLPIEVVAEDHHSVRLSGGDGTVTITVHRHGADTVVEAATDQLRTSRLDGEVQYYLTMLPYQPGDRRSRGEAQPGGLSRSG